MFDKKVLEIGFGNGEYIIHQASENADTLFIGIEVSHGCVLRAMRRARAFAGGNLRFMAGDARFLTRELFGDEEFDRVQMNFPCPWPKERHARHRVTSKDLSDTLAAVLKREGYFELVTDDEKYAEDTRAILGAHPALAEMGFEKNPAREHTTRYERKWLELGRDIWRVRIQKKSEFTVERITSPPPPPPHEWGGGAKNIKEEIMHVRLASANIEILDRLFDTDEKLGDACWVFKRHFVHKNVHLVETISTDAGFEQKYYLKVVEEPERVLVKIDGNSSVFLTPSVRGAIQSLARRIQHVEN